MAGNLRKCTSISSFLFDGIAALTQRRGYAAAAAAATAEVVRQSRKVEEKAAGISAFTGGKQVAGSDANKESAGSWIPDPITGYYRPVNQAADPDAADLRKTHC